MTHKCPCGETNPEKFYGNKTKKCGRCHNEYTKNRGKETRLKAIGYLGGRCQICGYDEFSCSLDIHHSEPDAKDPNFSSMRGWSWSRVMKEIQSCTLLCRNCHSAVHSGHLQMELLRKSWAGSPDPPDKRVVPGSLPGASTKKGTS